MVYRNIKLFIFRNSALLILFLVSLLYYFSNSPDKIESAKLSEPVWTFNNDGDFARLEREEIKRRFHRIPNEYFKVPKNSSKYVNYRTCGGYPWFSDLRFSNNYWQTLETEDGSVQVLSAAYDDRDASDPVVRIVSMINRNAFNLSLTCQLWYTSIDTPLFSERVDVEMIWINEPTNFRDGSYLTYMITCHIPESALKEVPESVSVVKNKCDLASNNVKVFNERLRDGEEKKNFGVCVRAVNFAFSDYAVLLTEWIGEY